MTATTLEQELARIHAEHQAKLAKMEIRRIRLERRWKRRRIIYKIQDAVQVGLMVILLSLFVAMAITISAGIAEKLLYDRTWILDQLNHMAEQVMLFVLLGPVWLFDRLVAVL